MGFSVGIVGLPNVGKSTLFKALTKKPVGIADYPFTTLSPNVGVVTIPDERLEKIAKVIKPQKISPAIIEFVDIAGLVKEAHKGEGLGNRFLAQIRICNAILEVIRAFQKPNIEYQKGEINPKRDEEIIKTELLMKDLGTLENLLEKLNKEIKKDGKIEKKFNFLKRVKEEVSRGKAISELNLTDDELQELKEFQFLTAKPILYIINISKEITADNKEEFKKMFPLQNFLFLNLKLEEEISELSESDVKELGLKSQLDQLILKCYAILDLITFYTVAGGKEIRAWTIKRGTTAQKAAGLVHSDFEEKFIKAEVVSWQKLAETGSWAKTKEYGWLKTIGKNYLVEDGDVMEFKI